MFNIKFHDELSHFYFYFPEFKTYSARRSEGLWYFYHIPFVNYTRVEFIIVIIVEVVVVVVVVVVIVVVVVVVVVVV